MGWIVFGITVGLLILCGHWYVGKATELFLKMFDKMGWKTKPGLS